MENFSFSAVWTTRDSLFLCILNKTFFILLSSCSKSYSPNMIFSQAFLLQSISFFSLNISKLYSPFHSTGLLACT